MSRIFIILFSMAILDTWSGQVHTAFFTNRLEVFQAVKKPLVPVSCLTSDKDPVCQMKLTKAVSDTTHYAEQYFGFCSKGCKKRFQQRPSKFIK